MDLEGLARLGFDPFSVDVGHILLKKILVVQLAEHVNIHHKTSKMVFKAGRTGGMF